MAGSNSARALSIYSGTYHGDAGSGQIGLAEAAGEVRLERAIFTVMEKCVACKGCEMACAIEHSQSKNLAMAMHETPTPRPRVRVQAAGSYSYPSRCNHCQDAACVTACPTGAMARRGANNAVTVDKDKCIGCWMCVMVCPFGGVTADPATKRALKCDLCPERAAEGLEPACVAACPTEALVFVTPEELADGRRRTTAYSALGAAARVSGPGEVWRSLRRG